MVGPRQGTDPDADGIGLRGRNNALDMVKRRAKDVGLSEQICNHTFRATGITAYLENGGSSEGAQEIAGCPRGTAYDQVKLYDRTSDAIMQHYVRMIMI